MSSDQNFVPAASSSPLAHMSVKAFASSCVFMMSNPFLRPAPGIIIGRRLGNLAIIQVIRLRQRLGCVGGKAIAFALFHHKWFTADRLPVACTYRASVHLDSAAERAAGRLGLADDIW